MLPSVHDTGIYALIPAKALSRRNGGCASTSESYPGKSIRSKLHMHAIFSGPVGSKVGSFPIIITG
jgi:hypothetical protein